jgi:hypothetical protein
MFSAGVPFRAVGRAIFKGVSQLPIDRSVSIFNNAREVDVDYMVNIMSSLEAIEEYTQLKFTGVRIP